MLSIERCLWCWACPSGDELIAAPPPAAVAPASQPPGGYAVSEAHAAEEANVATVIMPRSRLALAVWVGTLQALVVSVGHGLVVGLGRLGLGLGHRLVDWR